MTSVTDVTIDEETGSLLAEFDGCLLLIARDATGAEASGLRDRMASIFREIAWLRMDRQIAAVFVERLDARLARLNELPLGEAEALDALASIKTAIDAVDDAEMAAYERWDAAVGSSCSQAADDHPAYLEMVRLRVERRQLEEARWSIEMPRLLAKRANEKNARYAEHAGPVG